MLTAWGKKVASVATVAGYCLPFVSATNSSIAFIQGKTLAGNTLYIPPVYAASPTWGPIVSSLVESGSSSSVGVAFGSGNTSPSENDYTLENLITGITANTPTLETFFDETNHKYVARLDYTIQNDTGAEISIKEVALFVRFNTATTWGGTPVTSAAGRYSFMIDRTLLASPVVIPNGDAGTVRYEFSY